MVQEKGDFYFQERKFNNKIFPPLKDFWNIKPTLYDPGINKFQKPKDEKFDIVISIDVLEHIPFQDLHWVIDEIFSFSKKIVFLNVACYPAGCNIRRWEKCSCFFISSKMVVGFCFSFIK